MQYLLILFSCFFLAACTSPTNNQAGTGNYPNSVYVAKADKAIESAVVWAPNAKVNLTIFSDFECPACIRWHEAIDEKLWKEYIDPKKITVTFKNYPLTMIHKNAEGDALASLCALANGNIQEFRTAMYKLEDVKQWAEVNDLERTDVAKKVGITDPDFGKCVSEAWYQKRLNQEVADGDSLKLTGTPSFYLNNTLMEFKNPDEFFAMLDAAMK